LSVESAVTSAQCTSLSLSLSLVFFRSRFQTRPVAVVCSAVERDPQCCCFTGEMRFSVISRLVLLRSNVDSRGHSSGCFLRLAFGEFVLRVVVEGEPRSSSSSFVVTRFTFRSVVCHSPTNVYYRQRIHCAVGVRSMSGETNRFRVTCSLNRMIRANAQRHQLSN
jgi:hypothetical protein